MIEFSDWHPDQPDLTGAVVSVSNVKPEAIGYSSVNAWEGVSDALDTACLGAFWVQDDSDSYFVFAGDAGKLYRMAGTAFSDVSKVGGYTVEAWEFVKWGERIIATSIEEPMQYYDMGTSSVFADLAGSPPKARHLAVVKDFLIAGNLDEGGTRYPSRVRWSGFNNSEAWTSDPSTQSDYQDLQGRGGAIQKIVPGATGLVMQEHEIRRMTYVGPPLIFRIDVVERDRGVAGENSVTWSGASVYYYSHDGFYVKHGDDPSVPIGEQKLDKWFQSDFGGSSISELYAAMDRTNNLVCWLYPSNETGENRILIYSPDLNKWGVIDENVEYVMEYASAAYDLDTLDGILTDIDAESIPVDSDAYLGGVIALGAFDTTHKLGTFSGDPKTATIEVGEVGGYRQRCWGAWAHCDGTLTMSVGTRDTLGENVSWGLPQSPNVTGGFDFRTSARYHRFKVTIADGFSEAMGIEPDMTAEGRR